MGSVKGLAGSLFPVITRAPDAANPLLNRVHRSDLSERFETDSR